MRSRRNLLEILKALKDRIASPSDVISLTGLPRYEVLASFHVLEALGIIRVVYSRGNYKLYQLTDVGQQLLDALEKGQSFSLKIEIPSQRAEDTHIHAEAFSQSELTASEAEEVVSEAT